MRGKLDQNPRIRIGVRSSPRMRGKLSLFTKTLEGDIWQTGQIRKETAAIFDALKVKMPAKYLDFPKPLPE